MTGEVVTQIDPPKSREQLALLLMRWNALQKAGVAPDSGHAEMAHLTAMLRRVAQSQQQFEQRRAELAAVGPPPRARLQTQLVAYKLLSRGVELPAALQHELRAGLSGSLSSPRDAASPVGHATGATLDEKIASLLGEPAPVPEKAVRNRMHQRLVELERLSANLGTVHTDRADLTPPDALVPGADELKLQALVELKGLRLLAKQKSMRQHLLYNEAATAADSQLGQSQLLRSMNRRLRPQISDELGLTVDLMNTQTHEREQQARHSQIELTKSAVSHAHQFVQHAEEQRQRKVAFHKHLTHFHSQVEREESRRAERTAKQRLQALRSNDEEAYIKLLDQTKDTRITHLLKQTNQFLASLSEAVRVQQSEAGTTLPTPSDEELEKIDYYEVAHRIKQPVTEQASILVGGKLKEYQLKGLEWMISLVNNNLNGILADEMGLGKTIQSISLITYLIDKMHWPGPFLVIVPLSTITNWTVEFEKWAPSVKTVVYKGPPNARKAQQGVIRSGDFQVLLTTYEYVIKDRPLLSKIRWQHMIIDEGHRMKNTQSKLSSTLVNHYYSRHRLILTGTPLQNNLPELWALLNFVLPKIFNSQKTFDEWFNTPFANTGGQDKMELTEEEMLLIIRRLHKVLRPFLLRRLKKDVEKDLPDKVEKVIKCKMSSLQTALYQQLLKYGLIYTGDGTTDGSNGKGGGGGLRSLNNKIMQLRKICNHPFVFQEVEQTVDPTSMRYDLLWRTAGKFELLDRTFPKFIKTGHRTLMFFQMTQIMDIMEDYLRSKGIMYLRLDGSTKADERSEKLRMFNAEDSPYFCFLLSTRAGGLGLNLQSADTVIIYDTDWNPFQDLQAQDRAHRIGQTKEVRILRLITEHSIEEAILDRAVSKLEIDGKVIQAGKFDNKSTNEEQEQFLRNIMEAEEARRENKYHEDEEMDDEEVNRILARSQDELELFKKLDDERADKLASEGVSSLFTEEELPPIYKADLSKVLAGPTPEEIGSRRERRKVIYDDGLTEEEWLKEQEIDSGDEAAGVNGNGAPESESEAEESESETPSSQSRSKRGAAHTNGSQAKRVKKEPTPDLLERGPELLDLLENQVSDDARSLSAVFAELPSRKDYPDYYKLIKKPVSLSDIRKRFDSQAYGTLDDLKADYRQMFANAMTYNMQGSVIYEDAAHLLNIVNEF